MSGSGGNGESFLGYTWLAGMERDPAGQPPLNPLYRVWVKSVAGDSFFVVEQESFGIASLLTDAINARLRVPGATSILGMAVDGEIGEVADNVVERIKAGKIREVKDGGSTVEGRQDGTPGGGRGN